MVKALVLAGTRQGADDPMAKAAVLTALLDLSLRESGTSFGTYLGAVRSTVPAGVSVGIMSSIPELLDAVDGYRAARYKRGFVGAEEEDGLSDFVRLPEAPDGVGRQQRGTDVFGESVRHLCFDDGGADCIDADAFRREFDGGGFGGSDDAVLGSVVGNAGGAADLSRDRGHVDDGSAAVEHHGRDLVFHREEDASEVDRDHLVPGVGIVVRHGNERRADDTGVVERAIEAAPFIDDSLDHALGLIGL